MITAHPVFTYRVSYAASVLSQASFNDFLLCLLTARQMKGEYLSRLPGCFLLVEIFYPNGKCVPVADLASAYVALDTLAPGTELGCPIRKNIRQLVESRDASTSFLVGMVY